MNTDRPDSRTTGRDSRATVTIKEAAAVLGLSVDAVRSRLHRGTLQGVKDGHTWRVYLPEDEVIHPEDAEPTVDQQSETVADRRATDALVEQLQDERERADVLQREALGRIEALSGPESREIGDEGPDRGPVIPRRRRASGRVWRDGGGGSDRHAD